MCKKEFKPAVQNPVLVDMGKGAIELDMWNEMQLARANRQGLVGRTYAPLHCDLVRLVVQHTSQNHC
jgi:hypothetical protein